MEEQQIQEELLRDELYELQYYKSLLEPRQVLTTITLDGKTYYNAEDIYDNYPQFFSTKRIKDKKNIRKIIKNYNITPDDYVYTHMRGGEFKLSSASNTRAKLLLTTEWINNIFKDMNNERPINIL